MEETHTFETDFKLKFLGYGEWIEEPDLVEFEYKDIKCRVIRILKREPYAPVEAYFGGHLCGYVRIPSDHPYHYKRYEEMEIECHFGLTYGQVHVGHWIGFDCGHSCDLIPTMKKLRESNPAIRKIEEIFPIPEEWKDSPMFYPTYKNMAYCIEECKSIVDQLIVIKEMSHENPNPIEKK